MKNFIESCIEANLEISDYILNKIKKSDLDYTDTIGEGGDNSLFVDIIFENIFIKHLSKYGNIYSEESGLIDNGYKHRKIILDPLDGSDNFLSDLPYYGTSVAFELDGEIKIAVICNLATGDLIYKNEEGKKSFSNLYEKQRKKFDKKSNIAIFERAYSNPKMCEKINKLGIKFRSPGAVALSLANVRDYKFLLFSGKLRTFDISGGLYINSDLNIFQNENYLLVSKNKDVFDSIKALL